ncbi:hypothetical protein TNCV_3414191 [Trichonephila clavipes]|uniref:Uncharacterized protein n=1 Tax=Trichonephila clavipes TaxID=2585209 RepID=A0A8X6RK18_TRICX|nr:hypothetical protein TNCV_3414191 [Trichonephila clavipes]
MSTIKITTTLNIHSAKPTMSSKIPAVTISSTSTQAHLLPPTFSFSAKLSESQPRIPLLITSSSVSNSHCTSVTSSSSSQALLPSTSSMFTALSTETHPSVLVTTTSSSIPPTITPLSQASKPHKNMPS